jgi:carbonic anhydrase
MISIFRLFLLIFVAQCLQSAVITKRSEESTASEKRAQGSLDFGYNGLKGAAYWPSIARTCGGLIQSPINIEPDSADFKETLKGVMTNHGYYPDIRFPSTSGKLKSSGVALEFTPNDSSGTFVRPDGAYEMIQWHIHSPSEHRVNGIEYPAELHCENPPCGREIYLKNMS